MADVQGKFEGDTYVHPMVTVHEDGKIDGVVLGLRKYFDLKPGDSIKDFGAELKALNTNDRVQLLGGIVDGSLDYAIA